MIHGLTDSATDSTTSWPIVRFNRICFALALLWLGLSLFASLRLWPNERFDQPAPEKHDFSQFYMGGVIARHGAWDALYPIPHADSLNSPGAWEYSETRPKYRALGDEAGVPEKSSRFIQPPPFALLMEPIAFLKYRLAKKVWNLLMVLCAWGVAVMAGRFYEIAAGTRSPLAGVIAMAVAVSPLTLDTLRLMNVSPFIALMCGLSVVGLLQRNSELGATAVVIGAASKYATAIFLPLYIAMRKWRAIVVMAILSVVILILSVLVMKTGPFNVFIKEMLPTFGRTHTDTWNRSFSALLMQIAGPPGHAQPLRGGMRLLAGALQWGSLIGLLAILFTRKVEVWNAPPAVMAAAAALLCWFLIFSPILWDHYFFYLVPLWGWLAREARRSPAKTFLIGGAILFQCLPEIITERRLPGHFHVNGQPLTVMGPYECFMLLSAVVIFLVAISRLLAPIIGSAQETTAGATHFSFSTRQFNRVCVAIAALWLFTATPAAVRRFPSNEGDFPQFYMGGVIARVHAWDAMYPIPRPGSHNNAGMETDSTMRPRYAMEAEKRGVGDRLRFIQPPPVALLLLPMGYLSYPRAFELWMLMLVVCGVGVSMLAGRIFELLSGRPTKIYGLVTLLVACSPLMLHAIYIANMTVPVALLIGIAIVQLVRRRDASSAGAIVLGTVTKYATLPLLPLAVAMRRWKLIVAAGFISIALVAVTFAVMGKGPFEVYFREIAPTLSRTHDISTNQSLSGFLERVLHHPSLSLSVRLSILTAEAVVLCGILWLMFRRPVEFWMQPANVLAAAMALLTLLLIFSPIFWEHYPVYLCPLWGWLIWEARRCPGRALLAVVAIALTYVPWTAWFDLREPYNTHILPSAILMGGLGVWRLWSGEMGTGASTADFASGLNR
jgi:hypothetical protein